MKKNLQDKSTIEQIRLRFDNDVERFSNLESGQQAAIDSPLMLELVSETAASVLPNARTIVDLGCGAGNFTLKLLQKLPHLDCTLVDLSLPMLERAKQRVGMVTRGTVKTIQSDLRSLSFENKSFDIVVAGAVLHHLRDDDDWKSVFKKLYDCLTEGGMLFVADMVWFDNPLVQKVMWKRYADYLTSLKGPEYCKTVFDYIEQEDSPRSVKYQFELLHECGFNDYDVLHRNGVFAAYFARKSF